MYRLKFNDKVIDSVHGFIAITKIEKEIANLPIFKRLGKIKQLSFANWVFPGAEHTRYTHSLGVMHIIDKMAVKLNYNDEERQILRLAALLHDIGHFPLSHDGETAYRFLEKNDFDNLENLILYENRKVKNTIDNICENCDKISINHMSPSGSKFHHEQISKKIILNSKEIRDIVANSECSSFINLEDICAIITGDFEYDNYRLSDMVQLLHSEVDADRIDYMMRDGFFSGTSYGDFGVGLLIDNLKKVEVNGVKIIGINQKGIASGDQFLMNRLLSYEQVMYNKKVTSLAYMAQKIFKYSIAQGYIKSNDEVLSGIEKNDISHLMFTDIAFWNCVEKIYNDNLEYNKGDEIIISFVKSLINNKELKHLFDKEVVLKVSPNDFKDIIKNTEIYQDLNNNDCNIPIFLMCDITKHRPIDIFEKNISHLPKGEQEKLKLHRLIDGITIINKDKTVNLLVDDKRSLMSTLYDTKLYILREYEIN